MRSHDVSRWVMSHDLRNEWVVGGACAGSMGEKWRARGHHRSCTAGFVSHGVADVGHEATISHALQAS